MIAVFDSGYGGLTVLKPIMDLLPQYDYLYLGDNARAPYGNHSQETIQSFCEQAVEYLFDQGATLIIFACNTASAAALRHVQEKYLNGPHEKDRKILGVLIPVAEKAVEISKNGRIGVIGTRATVASKAYEHELVKVAQAQSESESISRSSILPGASSDATHSSTLTAQDHYAQNHPAQAHPTHRLSIHSQACPLLVPLIEEGWHKKPEATMILKKYLHPLKSCNLDTLILGCTHYPFMLKQITRIMGRKTTVLPCGEVTAESLKDYLQRHPEIESKLSKNSTRQFLTTDSPARFQDFVQKNFGMKIKMPTKVSLG